MKQPLKQHLTQLLAQAVGELCRRGVLPQGAAQSIHLERTRDPKHGDFASNVALVLAQLSGCPPREIAAQLLAELPTSELLAKIEIAGPGFLNFFVTEAAYRALIDDIRGAAEQYGRSRIGAGKKAMVEFVSANPTGPLHVGHGRGAAYGDAVARLLTAVGYQTCREYYVNDAGRQMDILAVSVWLRYLECCASDAAAAFAFPANGYQGDYIRDLADQLHKKHGAAFQVDATAFFTPRAENPTENLAAEAIDDEARMDALIARCKECLGARAYRTMFAYGCDTLTKNIKQDLEQFGVCFDNWFSERSLLDKDAIARAIAALQKKGHIYQRDGVKWFKARDFGDEKDRAVVRANGSHTYFASDIAYHFTKKERGFDKIVNVFGADHHGYAHRIMSACKALGYARDQLRIVLVQFVALYRGGKKIAMSTRGGEFTTLRELREEVGNDVARFFYVSHKHEQHIDFDLDLAKAQSADNPVYYIQYAHARIYSVFGKLAKGEMPTLESVAPQYEQLGEPQELELMKTLSRFPEVVAQAANELQPHLLAYYLRALAHDFHTYYNAHPFLAEQAELRRARLGLIDAVRQVLANGLGMLGVDAPPNM